MIFRLTVLHSYAPVAALLSNSINGVSIELYVTIQTAIYNVTFRCVRVTIDLVKLISITYSECVSAALVIQQP